MDPVTVKSSAGPILHEWKGTFTDHLANERTFLAWIRTGLGIFAFGCAIARFGGSNNVPTAPNQSFRETKPLMSGLILITCGLTTLFYSIYRYYQINRQIKGKDLTEVSQIREPIIATFFLLLSLLVILVIFVIL